MKGKNAEQDWQRPTVIATDTLAVHSTMTPQLCACIFLVLPAKDDLFGPPSTGPRQRERARLRGG
jgi:hypothetical protein